MPHPLRVAVLQCAWAIGIAATSVLPVAAAGALPLVEKGQVVIVTATAGPAVATRQTVKFDAAALIKPIVAALGAAGYLTAGDGDRVSLAAHVVDYDSGSYVGFAKTARVAVDFQLSDAQGEALKQWRADCAQKAAFNLQSTATRNAAAVAACYESLAAAAVDGLKPVP